MERPRLALAPPPREHGPLRRRRPKSFVLRFAADIGLVSFYEPVWSAECAGIDVGRSLAETMKHEPRGLIACADHPVQLMRGHALFAGRPQLRGQKPF